MSKPSNNKSVWAWLTYPVMASMIRTRTIAAIMGVMDVLWLLSVVRRGRMHGVFL